MNHRMQTQAMSRIVLSIRTHVSAAVTDAGGRAITRAIPIEAARTARDLLSAAPAPLFMIENKDVFTLQSMLEANADDTEFCEWLRNAKVGDEYPHFFPIERLA